MLTKKILTYYLLKTNIRVRICGGEFFLLTTIIYDNYNNKVIFSSYLLTDFHVFHQYNVLFKNIKVIMLKKSLE